ncbi:MAG: hypothetical protein FWH27_03725 [Planctomycetaceae bacterium]|nr:hypothetical protein [Planctomycetaceae bacterium]
MKRNKYYDSIVLLLLIAGISSTFVVGQSNENQKIDATPRRLRGTLPPVTSQASVNKSPTLLPTYQPQDNSPSTASKPPVQVANAFGVVPATVQSGQVAQNAQQVRQVSHTSEEGDESRNVPASATIRQVPGAPGITASTTTGEQHFGTLSVTGDGNWGNSDDVPEHVIQGISQMQEQTLPPMPPPLGNGNLSPEITNVPPLLDSPQGEPRDNLTLRFDGNDLEPGSLPNLSFGDEPGGVIPFQPLLPPDLTSPSDGAIQVDVIEPPDSGYGNTPQGNSRMAFGNQPPVLEQSLVPQVAEPEERIARNSTVPMDIRNDGASLQLGNPLSGNHASSAHEEGTGVPGSQELLGAQIPQLVIEKIMPREVQINEPMTVTFNIRNTGSAKAKNVVLTDRLPKGTRFIEAGASASRTAGGDICWQLGDIGINEERNVDMILIPVAEGEIGSVATATFSVEASAGARVTKPALAMEVATASDEHLVGGDVVLEIMISNPGSGTARNITLEEFVPDGLSHPKGKKLSSDFGDLKPNESKRLRLTLKCERDGEMTNYLVAKGDNDLMVESKIPIVVLAPALTLAIDGPKNRFLERKATYELRVGNPGSAATRDVILIAKLPKGIDFVSTDSMGAYDPETRTVHWMLDTLPSQQSGKIELVTLPREIGEYKIEFVGRAQGGLQANTAHEVAVDGIASLGFEIANKVDPVELGREAVYEMRIFNRGTKASSNVSIRVQLPEAMRFVAAEGPTQHRFSGSLVDFGNLVQLAPREEKTYLVRAQCLAAGDHRVVVQVQSDEMERPVTKEENTNVYGDE